ncbi:MAG: response regulator [Burkholderiales bacterium]
MVAEVDPVTRAKEEIDAAFQRGMLSLNMLAVERAGGAGAIALPAAAAAKMLVEYRSRYVKGLIKFLKNDGAGPKEMYAAATGIELAQGDPSQRGFWWVVLAFFEAMIHKALPADVDTRPLCNGLEHRIRRLGETSFSSEDMRGAERLLRDMLYAIYRAEAVSDRLRAVKEAFSAGAAPVGNVDFAFDDTDVEVRKPARSVDLKVVSATSGAVQDGSSQDQSTSAVVPESDYVEIAGQQVSKSLFELFGEEARKHVATLKTELEVLKGHGIVTDAMLLAVHSLSGVAATVHFDNLRDLSSAFARALAPLSLEPLSSDEEDLIEQAIQTTERMVVEALGLAEPTPAPELLERLDGVAARAAGEAAPMVREEEVMLPEEEATIARDEGQLDQALLARAASPYSGAVVLDDQAAGGRRQRRMTDEPDADLMPAFLLEADRLIPSLADALLAWRAAPEDKSKAAAVADALQNLKGSARMAGVMSVGELGQHMESRVEAALSYASAPPSLIEELATSMRRMAVLFDKFQPQGGAALDAARGFATSAPAGADAGAPSGASRQQGEAAPRMLRVRADLIDGLVNDVAEASRARERISGQTGAMRATLLELVEIGVRLRQQLREIEGRSESLARLVGESVDDVDMAREELSRVLDETEVLLETRKQRDGELRRNVARLRMLPMSSLAERLHRVVRLSAKAMGKRANLDIVGTEVELERSVLERLAGPLEVLLQNAVGHGIEAPDVRETAGKPSIGEIRLEVSQQGEDVAIICTDDGVGLNLARIRERASELGWIAGQSSLGEADIVNLIFKSEFSCNALSAETLVAEDSLCGVRAALKSLGGSIDCHAEAGAKSAGARFSMRLPVSKDSDAIMAEVTHATTDARPGDGPAPLVLLADDSLSVRKNAERLFSREGYRVVCVRDGVEALTALMDALPDVLVIDADMPRMDGIELTKKIRANTRLSEVPIVLTSSRVSEERQKLANDIGADFFLAKPYGEEELLRQVAGFIAAVRSSEALSE